MRTRRVVIAFGISAMIAVAGYKARALSLGGACAATLVGASIIRRFGGRGVLTLGTFFVSGSLLSRLNKQPGKETGSHARNERQVLANGGIATLAGLLPDGRLGGSAVALLTGSLAAATSDTWATEIGIRSGQTPRYVISGRPVAPGLSGGVTRAGTLASVGGSAAIAALAAVIHRDPSLGLVVWVAGVIGSIVDSVLGELVQAKRRSIVDGRITESDARAADSVPVSGWSWVDNDVVNLACTVSGGLSAVLLWRGLGMQLALSISASAPTGHSRPSN